MLWPTETATDARASGRSAYVGGAMHSGTTLTDAAVRQPLWSTATARDGDRRGGKEARHTKGGRSLRADIETFTSGMWSTPRASDGDKGGPNARDGSGSLHLSSQAVQLTNGLQAPATETGGPCT